MWDLDSNFDYLCVVSGKKKILLDKTCSAFTIPPKGVVLLFDLYDYQDDLVNPIWKNLGNHLNIKCGDGQLISPPTIKKIIKLKSFSNMIWISKRAWDGAEIDFVWNLSHELQHLKRDIENHFLSLAGFFIYWNLNNKLIKMEIVEPKIPTTVPTEMDAELAAWQIVRKLFGKEIADSYVKENAKIGEKKDIFPYSPY